MLEKKLERKNAFQSLKGLNKPALTPQGFWVSQDPVECFSWDLLKGFVGRGQERVLPFALQQAAEVRCSHGSLQKNEERGKSTFSKNTKVRNFFQGHTKGQNF